MAWCLVKKKENFTLLYHSDCSPSQHTSWSFHDSRRYITSTAGTALLKTQRIGQCICFVICVDHILGELKIGDSYSVLINATSQLMWQVCDTMTQVLDGSEVLQDDVWVWIPMALFKWNLRVSEFILMSAKCLRLNPLSVHFASPDCLC
jgi:hypothetical protein